MKNHYVLAILISLLIALGIPTASGGPISSGDDFLQSIPGNGMGSGTFFNFEGPIGLVNLEGNPSPGSPHDSIVRRLEDANVQGPSEPGGRIDDIIDIQMMQLSLTSVDPVDVGGTFFDIFIELNPDIETMGTMTIRHDQDDFFGPNVQTFLGTKAASGTFQTHFVVHFDTFFRNSNGSGVGDFNLLDVDGGIPIDFLGGVWTHGPSSSSFLIAGTVASAFAGVGNKEYIHTASQVAAPSAIPEPSSFMLIVLGLGVFFVVQLARVMRLGRGLRKEQGQVFNLDN